MGRFAWTWKVKPECLEKYLAMHREPWPEILRAHSEAGISHYSIFQNGHQFFYVYDCEDPAKANRLLAENVDCQRWNAMTSQMIEGGFDLGQDEPIAYLGEIFYLK
ncbi:MAG: L-rhamnose mutarotase [Deltaproteobacteria bacterium]|jgi:L-rhamnose mutarotase|nr:L-rhamnose mutarotase [Deltaproteobacteria bacterium]